MVTIKESIDLLLQILHSFGYSKLSAEDFRLAKFNDNVASTKLWRLLFETVYYLKYGSIDEVCIRAFNYFTPPEITVYVKRELKLLGFVSHDLTVLPTDMSRGSRELLLAFGWLLCKETVIFRLHATCLSPLENAQENSGVLAVESQIYSQPVCGGDDLRDGLKQMVWLNGRLRASLKQLHGLQQERFNLSRDIHEATKGLSLDPSTRCHLSAFEVYLLKHPNLLRKNMKLLERDNQRIQNLLHWRDFEDEFWHWMESVLDLKIQEIEQQKKDDGKSSSTTTADSSVSDSQTTAEDIQDLSASYKRLHNSLLKYENIAELLEKQWANRTLCVSQSEVELMITAVDREIDRFIRGAAARRSLSDQCQRQQHVKQLTFQQDGASGDIGGKSAAQLKQPPPHQQLPNVSRDIGKEVHRLEAILAKLEEDVETNHTNFTKELQSMSNSTNSMVLFDDASI